MQQLYLQITPSKSFWWYTDLKYGKWHLRYCHSTPGAPGMALCNFRESSDAKNTIYSAEEGQWTNFTLKAAIRSSVPKLASELPKRHAKTLQTPTTAPLALIKACSHANWCLLAI